MIQTSQMRGVFRGIEESGRQIVDARWHLGCVGFGVAAACGARLRIACQDGMLKEAARFFMGQQKLLDALSKLCVSAASRFQPGGALRGIGPFQGGQKNVSFVHRRRSGSHSAYCP